MVAIPPSSASGGDPAGTAAALVAAHEADTTSVHGIADTSALVLTSDSRLSNTRTPTDASVTDAKVATGAAIDPAKIAGTAIVDADSRLLWGRSRPIESFPRNMIARAVTPTSGQLLLAFFDCRKVVTFSALEMCTGATQYSVTPTLVRLGFYTVDGSGNLTLAAAIASDTGIGASGNTVYSRSLSTGGGLPSTHTTAVGASYALAYLVVQSSGTLAQIECCGATVAALTALSPRTFAAVSGQTDLPTSIAVGSLANSGTTPWIGGS